MPSSSHRYDILTFGEGLLRLSTSRYERLEQADTLDIHVAGEALEIAVVMSRFGLRAAWLSALTENALGRKIVNKAREQGVDTSWVRWMKDGRVGLTYTEPGSAPRTSSLTEDREATGFAETLGSLDWSALRASRLLHIDSAVPIRYPDSMASLEAGFSEAHDAGCQVCVCVDDTFTVCTEDERKRVMSIAREADIVIITSASAECISDGANVLKDQAAFLKEKFLGSVVAVGEGRLVSPRVGTWQGVAVEDQLFHDRPYDLEVIDAAGAFGAFAGGFLYGYLTEGAAIGLRYGNAAAALSHSVPGNLLWITEEEITAQFSGTGAKLQR